MWGSSQVFQSDEAGTIREWVAVLDKESPAFQQATECCLQMLKDLRATEHELTQQLIQLKTEFSVYKHSIEDRLEGMRNLQVSAKRNKDELMRELEISKEAIKVLLAEMKELRASTERDKEELTRELKISKEAIKTLLEEMNELRVSGQNVARDLENSKEAKKTLLEEIGNLRASPVKECDEIDSANRRPLFKKLKGIFGSSKSKRLKKKRHLNQEAAPFQKQEPRANKEGRYSVTYGDSLEETRTDSGQWPQHSNSVSQSSLASSGMLLAGPSRGNYTDSGQESHKMTDSQHSLESDGVQQRSFASSRKRAVGPSHGNYTDSGQESNKMADSQHSLESDGVQQRSFASPGMVLADSPLGNCVYRFAEYKAMAGSQQSFYSDGAQQRSSGYSRNISSHGSANSMGCLIHQIHRENDVPLVHRGSSSRRELYRGRSLNFCPGILPYEQDTVELRDSEIKVEAQPKSQRLQEGSRVEFQFKVQGKEKLLYQWLKDGVELPEQNDTSLILERIKLRDFGWYKCRVRYQDSFGIAIESSRAWLDVIPQIQNGTRPKLLQEVDLHTRCVIASYLEKPVPRGLGGCKQVAAKFGMNENMIGGLEYLSREPGQDVMEFLKATKPDLTVYTFCKELKDDKIGRNDITKLLENHLSVTDETAENEA